MADVDISTLTHTQVPEPKWITISNTSDAGKVITPSSVTSGVSVIRKLVDDEISNKKSYLTTIMTDVSTPSTVYMVAPFSGKIDKVYTVISGAITTANSILTVKINNVAVTGGTITITQAGSAAGDVDSCTPSALNTFTEGQYISIDTDGGSNTTVSAHITLVCTRN